MTKATDKPAATKRPAPAPKAAQKTPAAIASEGVKQETPKAKTAAAKSPAAKVIKAKTAPVVPEPVKATATAKTSPPPKATPKTSKAAATTQAAVSAPPVAPPKGGGTVVPTPRRGRRAAAVPVPTPQPEPSHSPDAAKATFSNFPERVMTFPVHSPARKDPKLANNWKNKPVAELTDEEVLSMSDDDYMNDVQQAFFRLKLVRLKTDILANAGETTEHLREDTVVVPDPADRATIEEEHALELRTRDRERKLLKKIEQSIARIDAGDYGYCDETGEPIGVGRLIARPTASLSLEAQQRRELKQKMFGD